jgi:DNA repair protein RecO (recombination protein O)
MPLHDAQALVLRTYKLAEADKICVLLTRQAGKLRGIAYGARKMRSRFGSSLEPFTEISMTYFQKEGRDLVSISNAEIVRSHFETAAASVEAGAAMSYLTDMLCEFLPDHEPNETVYRLVAATLDAFDGASDLTALVRYFEVWLLKLAGFFPDLRRCAACDAPATDADELWLSSDGSPRCGDCSGRRGVRVGPRLRATLARILAESPARFAAAPPAADELDRLAEIALLVVRHSLERDLKSYALFNRLRREMDDDKSPGSAVRSRG